MSEDAIIDAGFVPYSIFDIKEIAEMSRVPSDYRKFYTCPNRDILEW